MRRVLSLASPSIEDIRVSLITIPSGPLPHTQSDANANASMKNGATAPLPISLSGFLRSQFLTSRFEPASASEFDPLGVDDCISLR